MYVVFFSMDVSDSVGLLKFFDFLFYGQMEFWQRSECCGDKLVVIVSNDCRAAFEDSELIGRSFLPSLSPVQRDGFRRESATSLDRALLTGCIHSCPRFLSEMVSGARSL